MEFDINRLKWTRQPAGFTIAEDKIEMITAPHTDLWQRTFLNVFGAKSLRYSFFDKF